jgi:hypothetical protein
MSEKPILKISPEAMAALTKSMERFFCPGFIGPLPAPPSKEEMARRAEAFDRALKDPETKFLID